MTGLSPTWTSVLGWTLMHFLWQGTRARHRARHGTGGVPRRFARVRYALGCSTLALMLAVPTATAWRLSDPQRAGLAVLRGRTRDGCRVRIPAPAATSPERLGATSTASLGSERSADPAAIVPVERHRSVRGHAVDRRGLDAGRVDLLAAARRGLVAGPPAGVRRRARRRARRGSEVEGRLAVAARASCDRCGCWNRRASPCRSSSAGSSRRCWCRPPCSAGCTPSELEAVLAHELAHIRRHDYLVNLLQSARRDAALLSPRRVVGVARRPRPSASTAATTSRWRPAATPCSTRAR